MIYALAEIKAAVEEAIADENLPDEIAPGISVDNIKEAIGEIFIEELNEFNQSMENADPEEQQEALRLFVEAVAEKIALMMAFGRRNEADAIAIIDADEAMAITRSFFASGSAKIQLTISERD